MGHFDILISFEEDSALHIIVSWGMSLPHYRGNEKSRDMHNRPGGAASGGRIDEVNQSLLEQQNDQRWVSFLFSVMYLYILFVIFCYTI
jgi:hypothetical protein